MKPFLKMRIAALAALALVFGSTATSGAAADPTITDDQLRDEVPFVVTPPRIVERMLALADVAEKDHLADLGSGDGRIVIAAAKRGARSIGFEIDPALVMRSQEIAKAANVAGKTEFKAQDIFDVNLAPFSVVSLYLLPEFNLKLRPRLLAQLQPGTRVVSHDWDMGDWRPDEALEVDAPLKPLGQDRRHRVFLWVIPAKAEGTWKITLPESAEPLEIKISQRYQKLTATPARGNVTAIALRGSEISFNWQLAGRTLRFAGQISGDEMRGTLGSVSQEYGTSPWQAVRAPS